MLPEDWIAHRRGDGEIIGYVEMVDDGFRPYDLLGRPLGAVAGWETAETLIERAGLSFLAEPHLADLGGERRVRVTEVTRSHVTLVADDFGAAQSVGGAPLERWVLELPTVVELCRLKDR